MPTRKYESNADRQRAYRENQRARKAAALVKDAPKRTAIGSIPSTARWTALQDQARAAIQTMLDEMEAYRDDRSEQWQERDRAAQFEEKIETATEIRDALEGFSLN
jgi:TRAP-type C4-dicarboxylate transport system substrate-binding protein